MRLELTGRHIDITPALRKLVETRVGKLDRLLNDSAVSAQVVLTRERNRLQAEITLHARGEKFLHSVATSSAWVTSVGQATDRLAQQARKLKGKWQERKRHGVQRTPGLDASGEAAAPRARRPPTGAGPGAGAEGRLRMPKVFRSTRQTIQAMSVADAVRTLTARNDLVVFHDPERVTVSVLYRRSNGELTLVETDA